MVALGRRAPHETKAILIGPVKNRKVEIAFAAGHTARRRFFAALQLRSTRMGEYALYLESLQCTRFLQKGCCHLYMI